MPDGHAGFRKGRGTQRLIASIFWILQRSKEFQKKISFRFYRWLLLAWKAMGCSERNGCAVARVVPRLNRYRGQEATVRTEDYEEKE